MENARAIKEQLDVSTILGTVKSTVNNYCLLHLMIDIFYEIKFGTLLPMSFSAAKFEKWAHI